MTEIASPSSFLSGADLVPPGQRDPKPRSGSVPSVRFGALVSEAAQNRVRPNPPPEDTPKPRELPKAASDRAVERQEARDTDAPPPREKPARAEVQEKPAAKANRKAEGRKEELVSGSGVADEVTTTEEGNTGTGLVAQADGHVDEKACFMPEPGIEGEKCESMPVPVPVEELTAGPMIPPTAEGTTGGPALPPPSLETTGGPALPPPVPVVATEASALLAADGDVPVVNPGIARTTALVGETPAMPVSDPSGQSETAPEGKLLMPIGTGEGGEMKPEVPGASGTKGSADLVALLQSRHEAAGKTGLREQATPDMPKTNFGDWINDFAIAQGAVHRSGDLVGSLDRALAGLPTPHAGQDALRPTPLQMLPIEIGMQAVRGVKTFQIRLDPAELGRVDVKLEIKEDGEVKANLVVDRVETLAMLKRDANTLQQAFEQAGLRQSPDGLNFQLRGEQQGREGQRQNEEQGRPRWSNDLDDAGAQRPAEFVMRRVMIPNSSLDLVI